MIPVQFRTAYSGTNSRLSALQFGPDGRTLAAVWRTDWNILSVAWWDLQRREQVDTEFGTRIGEDDATPPDPALSPDHQLLARMENERGGVQRLVLVDRSTPKRRTCKLTAWPYERPDDYPDDFNYQAFSALTFSPDGSYLYALVFGGHPEEDAGDGERIGVYRWHIPAVLRRRGKKSAGHLLPDPGFFLQTPAPEVFEWAKFGRTLVIGPDGRTLAAGCWDRRVLGWSLPAGEPLPAMGVRKKRKQPTAWRLAFSPDGRALAVADEAVTVYDTATGKPRLALPPGPAVSHPQFRSRCSFVFDLAYEPAGRRLATAAGDPFVRLWDATTGTEQASYDWDIGGVTAVAFSPDGCLCAAGGQDGRVAVWDVDG
jgi:WD40 repeat protein